MNTLYHFSRACDEEEKTKTQEKPKQTNKERQKHRNRSRHAADKEEPTIQNSQIGHASNSAIQFLDLRVK
jgi:hypothetical protein